MFYKKISIRKYIIENKIVQLKRYWLKLNNPQVIIKVK